MYSFTMDSRTRAGMQSSGGNSSDHKPIAESESEVEPTSTTPEWSEDSPEVEEMTEGEKKALQDWEEGRKERELEAAARRQREWEAEQRQRAWEQAIQQKQRDEARYKWERANAEDERYRKEEVQRSVARAALRKGAEPRGDLAAGALRDWTRVTSCELCRVRKLKCDRVIGGCSNCRTRNEICSYTGHPPTEHKETVGLSALERNREEIKRLRSQMSSLTTKLGLSEQDAINLRLEAERRYAVHVAQQTRPPDPFAPPPLVTLRRTGQPRPTPPPQASPQSIHNLLHPTPMTPYRPYYTQAAFGPSNPPLASSSHSRPHAPPPPPAKYHPTPSHSYYSTSYATLTARLGIHARSPPPPPPPAPAAPQPAPSAPTKFASPPPPPLPPVVKKKLPPFLHPKPRDDPDNIIHRRGSDATVEVLYAEKESPKGRSPLFQPNPEPVDTTLDSISSSEKVQESQPPTSRAAVQHPSRPSAQQGEKRPHSPPTSTPHPPPPSVASPNFFSSHGTTSRPSPQPPVGLDPPPKRRKRSNSAPVGPSNPSRSTCW